MCTAPIVHSVVPSTLPTPPTVLTQSRMRTRFQGLCRKLKAVAVARYNRPPVHRRNLRDVEAPFGGRCNATRQDQELEAMLEASVAAGAFADPGNVRTNLSYIRSCDRIVLVESGHTIRRPWCVRELHDAFQAGVLLLALRLTGDAVEEAITLDFQRSGNQQGVCRPLWQPRAEATARAASPLTAAHATSRAAKESPTRVCVASLTQPTSPEAEAALARRVLGLQQWHDKRVDWHSRTER
jgi:hypothetical protein